MTAGEKIDLLLRQKERIDDKQFDLASWKKTTSTLLEKIFGSADPRINTIEELKIDYGSWALRDASSTYDPVKTCKKIASDIIEMSIDELKIAKSNEGSGQLEVLRQHLTGNQVDEIVQILSLKSKKKAKPQLQKLLANLKAPVLSKILGDFLIGSNK